MKLFSKAAGVIAAALLVTGGIAPVAQGQALQVVTPEQQESYVQQFHHDGDTPPVVDGVGGYTEEEVAEIHEAIRQAQESGTPNDELIPGEMWSDKVELPSTIDKAAADEAEIAIAQQQAQPQARALAASCQTFWPSPHQVCGAILERYIQQGAQFGWMLLPTEGQALNPDGQGYRQRFMAGFIYWHPSTGAHAVNNYSAQVWERNGWETGWMGYPTGGEVPVSGSNPIDGELSGWVQTFQGGRVYRSPVLDGFQVASINGLILDRWLALGGPNSVLGFPIADEAIASDGVGRFSVFQNGVIYWHPAHGAWEVYGDFESMWMTSGGIDGLYGYPLGGITSDSTGTWQNYEGGQIFIPSDSGSKNYACMDVVGLILQRLGREDAPVDFYCDYQGATISLDGGETHFYAPTRDMLVTSSSSLFEPQARALPDVECNSIGFVDASPAIRLSAYSVRKNIDTCVGRAVDGIPEWSKEFSYSIKHTLTQRRLHKVELTIESLTFPSRVFQQNYALKEDRKWQIDPTVPGGELYTANGGTNTAASVSSGTIPETRGTYYLQATNFTLRVPSKGYELTASKWNGARLNIGRFKCDPFDERNPSGNRLCEFTNPVDDR